MVGIEEKLNRLGDPSGRQDAEYWDSWFKIVCLEQDHRPYEWYCEPSEVLRVVTAHLKYLPPHKNSNSVDSRGIIHPGSGTSLVPIVLSEKLEGFAQVVVDVSQTAIDEMRSIHDQSRGKRMADGDEYASSVCYFVADVLKPPMPFQSSSFVSWIDKGFIDAIFSKDNSLGQTQVQAAALFQEASRLLVPNDGFMLIISLAEEHSLHIILDNFLSGLWNATMHVWEIEPVSGNMRPFGFVFHSDESPGRQSYPENPKDAVSHQTGVQVVWHKHSSRKTNADEDLEHIFNVTTDQLRSTLDDLIVKSRLAFKATRLEHSVGEPRMMLVFLDVKPIDTDVDLVSLSSRIRSHSTTSWQPIAPNDHGENKADTCYHMIVPIGFGLSKLQLCGIVLTEVVDDLPEFIESCERESIQSVDIDWTQSSPISNTQAFLSFAAPKSID
ncbi:hypothetical protein ACA910_000158 [Epithemia clementina (nom. ined.)]